MAAREKVACDLRLLRADEIDAAYELFRACFGEIGLPRAAIRDKFFAEPGPDVRVVVAEVQGRLIGQQAATFLPFLASGREQRACMFTGGMTHPDYQGRGVFRQCLNEAERLAFDDCQAAFIFTMPNDQSLPAFARSSKWCVLPNRTLYAVPLRLGGVLHGRGIPGPIAAALGSVGSLAFARPWKRDASRVDEVASLAPNAAELDAFWARWADRFDGLICKRDHAFLDWRFVRNSTRSYRYFISRAPDGTLDGYAVTTTEARMGTTIGYIVDTLYTPGTDAVDRLVARAAATLRDGGATVLGAIVQWDALEADLRRIGFRAVPTRLAGRSFHTAVAPSPRRADVRDRCQRSARWAFTLADFDTI
jgi:GNAT superfamily N-acetyltransferase